HKTRAEVKEQIVRLLTTHCRPTLLAQDVMTQPVKSIGLSTTVAEASERMTMYGLNVFPILDDQERYAGLVSRELIQKALFHRLGKRPVCEIMQTDAYLAAPETAFHEIEATMIERNQRFVPVVKGTKVIGVITR